MSLMTKQNLILIGKYGAPAVLFLWVARLEVKYSSMEEKYDDCMNARVVESRQAFTLESSDSNNLIASREAVMPKKQKLIQWE